MIESLLVKINIICCLRFAHRLLFNDNIASRAINVKTMIGLTMTVSSNIHNRTIIAIKERCSKLNSSLVHRNWFVPVGLSSIN